MNTELSKVIFMAVLLGMETTPSHAKSSGWMEIVKLRSFMSNLHKRKLIPVSISCKKSPGSRFAPLVKVNYRPNSPRNYWRWAWGTSYRALNGPLLRAKFTRVSYSEAAGKFKPIKCALWHKKASKKLRK